MVPDVSKDCHSFELLESEVEGAVILRNFVNYLAGNMASRLTRFTFSDMLYFILCSAVEHVGVYPLCMLQEIQERFSQLLEERQCLHTAWQHKKVHLDQLIDLQFFLRDAKQIDTLSSSQEVALAGTDIGTSVDEVDVAVKKHEAFEKLLTTQEEKVLALQEHGDKLLAQNHFESGAIARRLGEVVQRRAKVHELCAARRQRLDDALHHAQFVRDVAEVSHGPRWSVTLVTHLLL